VLRTAFRAFDRRMTGYISAEDLKHVGGRAAAGRASAAARRPPARRQELRPTWCMPLRCRCCSNHTPASQTRRSGR
jgi:hypothetical protein